MGSQGFLPSFSLPGPSVLNLRSCKGQTDGQTDNGHQHIMPPPYGGTGITILTLFNLVLVDSLDQLEVSAEESFQPRLANSEFGHSGTPSPPFPLPSLLPFPQGAHPLNQLGRLGSTVSFHSWVWGKAPADK